MRVALIAPLVTTIREPQRGGSQALLADLAGGLAGRGHDVDVYAARGSEIEGVRVIDTGIDPASLIGSLYRAGASTSSDNAAAVAAFSRVITAVAHVSYDVVHNHAFDPPAIKLAAGLEAPVMHTLHLPPEPSVAMALEVASHSTNPPTIVAVSRAQARAWSGIAPADAVIPNGVPTKRIPWSVAAGAGAVFAGRFSPEKGAAEAIAIASTAGMAIDLYGDAYDRDYAERHVYPMRGQPGVTIHPAIERAQLWEAMARAAVVLCPAGWDEPFGLVAAEAQACGTPVVAFRRGGLEEVVVDGVTGILVDPGDSAAAASALDRVADIDRQACRRHAEVQLDIEAVLDAHERLYRQVLLRAKVAANG